jgi:hypothetical protein
MYTSLRFAALCCVLLSACEGSATNNKDGATNQDAASHNKDAALPADQRPPVDLASMAGCEAQCVADNAAAYTKFLGYALQACACAKGAACATACTADCASMIVPSPTSTCGSCLVGEASQGTVPACVTESGLLCEEDASCAPFIACGLKCGA